MLSIYDTNLEGDLARTNGRGLACVWKCMSESDQCTHSYKHIHTPCYTGIFSLSSSQPCNEHTSSNGLTYLVWDTWAQFIEWVEYFSWTFSRDLTHDFQTAALRYNIHMVWSVFQCCGVIILLSSEHPAIAHMLKSSWYTYTHTAIMGVFMIFNNDAKAQTPLCIFFCLHAVSVCESICFSCRSDFVWYWNHNGKTLGVMEVYIVYMLSASLTVNLVVAHCEHNIDNGMVQYERPTPNINHNLYFLHY